MPGQRNIIRPDPAAGEPAFTGSRGPVSKLPSSVKATALVVALVLSAALTATALRTTSHHWLGWISFLPVFMAVRWLRPVYAAMAGGLWGACLYVFCLAGPAPAIDPSLLSLALLIVIPGVYAGLGAMPTRPIGFNLLVLALGWTLIEAILLRPLSLQQALMAATRGEDAHLHWIACLLGYVSAAFLVGCVNASLVGLLGNARLRLPSSRSLPGSPNLVGRLASQVILAIQSWTLRQAQARAPPIPVAAAS